VRLALAGVVAGLALFAAGCGGDDDEGSGSGVGADSGAGGERVVIATADGSFNPGAVYETAAPGVVTIISVFGGGGDDDAQDLFGGEGASARARAS